MDRQTGNIYNNNMIQQLIKDGAIVDKERFTEMVIPPTPKQEETRKISKDDPCPCGSGEVFEKCCLRDRTDIRFNPVYGD